MCRVFYLRGHDGSKVPAVNIYFELQLFEKVLGKYKRALRWIFIFAFVLTH